MIYTLQLHKIVYLITLRRQSSASSVSRVWSSVPLTAEGESDVDDVGAVDVVGGDVLVDATVLILSPDLVLASSQ